MFKSGQKSVHDDEDSNSSQNESEEMKGAVHSHLKKSLRPFIDLIDKLRSIGIQKDLALPTIAVIGDQSSGKSSVLEALSGVALPRGSGIVTRCPLELRLKKVADGVKWKAVITYCKRRNDTEQSSFGAGLIQASSLRTSEERKFEFDDPSLVHEHVARAQNELAGRGVGICDDLITLEVMSPDVCDLTLIDLPGITRVPVKGQPDDIGKQIKELIMKFTKKQATINMVVVPCNTDIATTEALKMAQEVDPDGKRTIAILTKPDLLDKGLEKTILKIVNNEVIPLRKGYIMVKCRGQQQIDDNIPLQEATQTERDFFQNHDYFRCLMDEDKATIKCLAVKLTEILVDHIKKSLPQLSEQIKKQLWDVENVLKDFKDRTPEDRKGARQFLIKVLTRFNDKIRELSSGELINGENMFDELRAEFKKWNDYLNSTKIPFDDSKVFAQRSRGRELPGFSSYKVFETILQRHVAKLKKPATELLFTVKEIITRHMTDMISRSFQNYPALQNITMNKIRDIQLTQQVKAEQRISEQFQMENMIFTQDCIFMKLLNEITNETFSEDELPVFDKECTYSHMLEAYYEIVVQRMADQLPMMISLFMLNQTAEHLCAEMLALLGQSDPRELLSEDSDISRRHKELRNQLKRLSEAEKEMKVFLSD